MLLTLFLAIVTCAAITIMLFSAVAFIQDKKMFSSAPQEFREVIKPRDKELFSAYEVSFLSVLFPGNRRCKSEQKVWI